MTIHNFKFEFAEFTPGEVQAIAGVSTDLQRDWRRRGYLAHSGGHARFDPIEVLKLWFMSASNIHGIGPARSRALSDSVGLRLFWHALKWREAWDGPVDDVPGRNWGDRADWLTSQVIVGIHPHKYFISFAVDGEETFTDDLQGAIDGRSAFDPAVRGPLIVLPLEASGGDFLTRAGRPLVRFWDARKGNQK